MDAANGVLFGTLSDLEATLRQVKDVLGDFGDSGPEVGFEEELEIDGRRSAGLMEVL